MLFEDTLENKELFVYANEVDKTTNGDPNTRLTWSEIKEKYPDQLVGLASVKYLNDDNTNIESACVSYVNRSSSDLDKLQILGIARELFKGEPGQQSPAGENMGTYREWIEKLKKQWIGKTVIYENEKHKVIDVDYNGFLLIDKKARWTDTTAVSTTSVQEVQ